MDTETILRVGAFGCFIGHGWIAAWKLEFGGWSKFMDAAGFTEPEAHQVMPVIGWMDVALAANVLLRPNELCSAWMATWAFSTALVRPFSAGWDRASKPLSDNALWGFVERASNWACPLALLAMQKAPGYAPKDLFPGTGLYELLEPFANGYSESQLAVFMAGTFALAWFVVVPVLRAREGRGKKQK